MTTRALKRIVSFIALLIALGSGTAHAHRSSDAFINLSRPEAGSSTDASIQLRWDIALRDLDARLDLDVDRDGRLTWGEVRRRHADIERLAVNALSLSRGASRCAASPMTQQLDQHSDGTYAVLSFTYRCPASSLEEANTLRLRYELFKGFDAGHRAILTYGSISRVLSPDADTPLQLMLPEITAQTAAADENGGAAVTSLNALGSFIGTGMHHILIGWDHLAFLALLILPSVLIRQQGRWIAAEHWQASLKSLLMTVTAFTLAHSITLSLSALGAVVPPPGLIEPLIALSIVAAAALNLWPLPKIRTWALAFGFGLVHGFGFASALSDAGLTGIGLAVGLLGFNLGVELGQILFIALCWAPLWFFRRSASLGPRAVPALSVVLGLMGAAWFVQRVFDLSMLPG